MEISTLDEARKYIELLEKENKRLTEEVERLRNRKMSGRKTHNEKWTNTYNNVSYQLSNGITIDMVAKDNDISLRTAYRYKAYYEKMKELNLFRENEKE